MVMRRLFLGLTCIAMMGAPASVQAQEDYGRPGGYAGGGLALGFEQFDGTGGVDFDTGVGFDIWAGYRIAPHFAAELQLEYMGRMDLSVGGLEVDALAFTGNVKGYLTTGQIQPFALVGMGFVWAEVEALGVSPSDTGFGARFGGGVDCYVTPNLSVGATASYVLATGDVDGFDYVSLVLGAQYRF